MNFTRRKFIKVLSAIPPVALVNSNLNSLLNPFKTKPLSDEWNNPPREFSQAPFWFWNDELSEQEIARQIKDFSNHGVYGFVIHPRVGLPKSIGWMSDRMLSFMHFAIREAKRQNMWVVLYDEGMYPSGSSSGQVVAENPLYRPRGLFAIDLDDVKPSFEVSGFNIDANGNVALEENQKLVAIIKRKINGHRIAIVDRFIKPNYSLIRGLHYLEDNPQRREDKKEVPEELPKAADILNPEAVKCFIKLVYQRYYEEFGKYFGNTINAIFTDEPSFLGRNTEKGVQPGNSDILDFVCEQMKMDNLDFLPALWFNDEPGADKITFTYYRALNSLLEKTYYKQIYDWCNQHGISLTGHPEKPDDIGHLRFFHIPGQDIVWRFVEPGKASALEGPQSTQAKCASSAMIHLKRKRNSNEYCGAYGHNFTFREMKWLANWLLIRGCNLLYPHAFYYSIRGPRIDERPPDVGPNSSWWKEFKPFANSTSRLCWLNTDSTHICEIAILGLNDYLPWKPAKVCFQNQYDFNYIEARHLLEDAIIDSKGIHIEGMNYKVLIIEDNLLDDELSSVYKLEDRIIRWNSSEENSNDKLITSIGKFITKDISISPKNEDIRIRHVVKNDQHYYILFNEGEENANITVDLTVRGEQYLMDSYSNHPQPILKNSTIFLKTHELKVITISV